MRVSNFILAMGAAVLLGGCADAPFAPNAGGVHPPANADHPRAEAVLARERQPAPAREPVREVTREGTRGIARDVTRDGSRDPAAALREGIRLYNNGDFTEAIARLNAPEILAANTATRVSALKYTAFSYCVTQRPTQCRQAFDRALRLDADFALAPGEEGHPMWTPVFEKARASRQEVKGAD
jgi:hypothetical protein